MLVSLVKIGKLPHKFSEACNFPSRLGFYREVSTRGNISGARKTPQSCKTWGMFWIFSLQTPANERLRVCQFSQSEDQRSVSHLADDDLWSLKPVLSHDAPSVWVWVGTQCTVSKSLYTRRAIPKYFIKNMSKNKLQLEGIFIQTKVDISETKLWRLPSPQW